MRFGGGGDDGDGFCSPSSSFSRPPPHPPSPPTAPTSVLPHPPSHPAPPFSSSSSQPSLALIRASEERKDGKKKKDFFLIRSYSSPRFAYGLSTGRERGGLFLEPGMARAGANHKYLSLSCNLLVLYTSTTYYLRSTNSSYYFQEV